MTKLTPPEIDATLEMLDGWTNVDGALVKFFAFPDFVASLAFVNRVGEAAEAQQHHPDIDIRYNKVKLLLVTHDAGGITSKDADLAAQADALAVS